MKQRQMNDELTLIAPDQKRDGEAIFDLLAKVFHLRDYYYGRDWCREYYIGRSLYDWRATRVGVMGNEMVTHYGVWEYRMRIGSAVVKAGGVGGVATSGDYRKRGLMARTAAASLEAMRALGYDVTLLFGIDNFYRKLGYVRAWNETTYTMQVSDLPKELPQIHPRAFTVRHRDDLADLYNRTYAGYTGTAVRPTYQRCFPPTPPKGVLWRGEDGAIAGYLLYIIDGTRLRHVESVGDVEEILRLLGAMARRHGCREVQFTEMPYAAPLCRRIRRENCRAETGYRRDGGAMICLLNLPQALEKMTGELTRRLQASHLSGWEGNLRITGAGQQAMLAIAGGQVHVTPPSETPHAVHGGHEIAQFLIGTAPPAEVAEAGQMTVSGDAMRLLEVLFPEQHPMLLLMDRY